MANEMTFTYEFKKAMARLNLDYQLFSIGVGNNTQNCKTLK
jgi:hypothetical protein